MSLKTLPLIALILFALSASFAIAERKFYPLANSKFMRHEQSVDIETVENVIESGDIPDKSVSWKSSENWIGIC